MAIRRWRDAIGDDTYDPSDWRNADDCDYCGAPPAFQDGKWDGEVMAPEENQCPSCGAINLAPIEPITKKERKMLTEARINKVAAVLIQAVEVHVQGDGEGYAAAVEGLVAAARALDSDGASVLTNLAKGLLTLSGSVAEGEGDDAQD